MIEVWPKESHWLFALAIPSSYPLCTTVSLPTPPCVLCEIFFILHHIFPLFHIREKIFNSHRQAFFVLGFQTANTHSFFHITLTSDSEQKCKRVHTYNLSNKDQKCPQLFWGNIRKYFRNIWGKSVCVSPLSFSFLGKQGKEPPDQHHQKHTHFF